jgi:hypothetical protein
MQALVKKYIISVARAQNIVWFSKPLLVMHILMAIKFFLADI